MPRYAPEPPHVHGQPGRTAVLLVNLGTPEAPTAPALRRYLGEFLWDPRVVEIPRPLWWLILNGVILNTRPRKSAEKYAAIWLPEGSPLRVYTERQAKLLKGHLGAAGHGHLLVEYAMRYGEPAIGATLDRLKAAGATRVLVVPLYPQYAASTTASVFDDVADWGKRTRHLPALRFVRDYHDDKRYIAALAASVREHWQQTGGKPSGADYRLVMSFHGLPRRSLDLGDPYFCECQKTGRLLAAALGLNDQEYLVTFQSRFGKAEWLQPYTQPTLEKLAREGVKRVDTLCPGFAADCLETLEEIAMECKAAYLSSGGGEFHYIPCLNDRPDGIAMLAGIVADHLGDWIAPQAADPQTAQRARALGAAS
jgi:ferrochelatase